MVSVVAAALIFAAMLWIVLRRPPLGMILCFFFFAFAWRLVSSLYIDLNGPLFSEQLVRDIGPGHSVVPLALSQAIVIAAILISFREKRTSALSVRGNLGFDEYLPGRFRLADLAFAAVCLFVAALYTELFIKGPIPLLAGMERLPYTRQFGGPLHHLLLSWGFMLAFQLGVFFANPLLRCERVDWRFACLLLILILYLVLIGHRFSPIFGYTSFFIAPLGAVLICSNVPDREVLFSKVRRGFFAGAVAFLILIVTTVSYSYTVVRGFEGSELVEKVSQRLFVQQGEMWWTTYERVFIAHNWDGAVAATKLFISPFDPHRNSTMQYLMELALPLTRAHDLLGQGSAYSGGWPEVFFELGGIFGGFALVMIAAAIFSEFVFFLVRCIVEQRFAATFFLTPLFFALSVLLVSGMVNSLSLIHI